MALEKIKYSQTISENYENFSYENQDEIWKIIMMNHI